MARQNTGPIAANSSRPYAPDVDHLLTQVARGDRDAFAAVYEQVAGPVYGLVRQLVGDLPRSQQVTGDVLTEVWRTAPQFSPANGSGISWVMALARRRAVGYLRTARQPAGRRAPRPDLARLVQDISERAGLGRPGNPDAARPDSTRPDEAAGLAALPEPQRQALLLICYGGYAQGQVATMLGVPDATVADWIRDGLPLLAAAAS